MCKYCDKFRNQSSNYTDNDLFLQRDDIPREERGLYSDFSIANPRANSARSGGDNGPAQMSTADRIRAEHCAVLRAARLPCTVITGFLGAGKTTFLNNVLTQAHGRKLAVLENEFGAVGVDKLLIDAASVQREAADVVLMPNGCMCCRVRGDIIASLKAIHAQGGLDGVLIELSGLSEVAPVLQTFFVDEWVQQHLKIDSVICVIDCRMSQGYLVADHDAVGEAEGNEMIGGSDNVLVGSEGVDKNNNGKEGEDKNIQNSNSLNSNTENQNADMKQLLIDQLNLSDVILMNKSDVLSERELSSLKQAVSQYNNRAKMHTCVQGQVDLDLVLGLDLFALDKALEFDSQFNELVNEDQSTNSNSDHKHDNSNTKTNTNNKHDHDLEHSHGHEHNDAIKLKSPSHVSKSHAHSKLGFRNLCIKDSHPVDWFRLKDFVDAFNADNEGVVARFKGVIWHRSKEHGAYRDTRIVLQGVYGNYQIDIGEWPKGPETGQGLVTDSKLTCMVFIGNLTNEHEQLLTSTINRMFIKDDKELVDVKEVDVTNQGKQRIEYNVNSGRGGFNPRLMLDLNPML